MLRACSLIAVVDGDTAFVQMLHELLTDEGYQLIECSTSREAQHMISTKKPDLVILDIWLEHREAGWDLLRLLRLVPATEALPIIVCSADVVFLGAKAKQLKQYQCHVLEKPFDLDVLLEKITGVIGLPRLLEVDA